METIDGVGVKRVVLTGSECTGKTTLAEALAAHYDTVCVPEFARLFVERKGTPVDEGDIEAIARGQMALEDEYANRAGRLLIQDTDLLSSVVYRRHYHGDCPSWIVEELDRRAADLYLLAGIDVPWVPDGMQRDRGDRRKEMQALFRDALTVRGLRFVEIRGALTQRMEEAVRVIGDMYSRG